MEQEKHVLMMQNATVHLTDGTTLTLSLANVYASGLIVNPVTREVVSPSGYLRVASR